MKYKDDRLWWLDADVVLKTAECEDVERRGYALVCRTISRTEEQHRWKTVLLIKLQTLAPI